jgi:hypothetical protein
MKLLTTIAAAQKRDIITDTFSILVTLNAFLYAI